MRIRQLFDLFVNEDRSPRVVTLVKVEADEERQQRIAQAIANAKAVLGEKWICHESHRITREERA